MPEAGDVTLLLTQLREGNQEPTPPRPRLQLAMTGPILVFAPSARFRPLDPLKQGEIP